MTRSYSPPTLLAAEHELGAFQCRSVEQSEWLRRYARQSAGTGTTRVLVVTRADSNVVVAYYGWCMASVALADVPARVRKGAGRYPQPVALLARLGVDTRHEGHGLGAGMLRDVIARTHALSEQIGCRALLIHAETTQARDFYLHLVPEFEASPSDEFHLLLLMKDIRRTLA